MTWAEGGTYVPSLRGPGDPCPQNTRAGMGPEDQCPQAPNTPGLGAKVGQVPTRSLFLPILFLLILRTFFISESLVLVTLQARGEVYLPPLPPPWPRLGWFRLDSVVSADFCL